MISRRNFIKLSGLAVAAAPFISVPRVVLGAAGDGSANWEVSPPPRPYGRVIRWGTLIRREPSIKSPKIGQLKVGEVVKLAGQTESSSSPTSYNKTWFHVGDGWAHSAWIQPSENILNEPLAAVDEPFWAEVSVPRTIARSRPSPKAGAMYEYNFSCTFQVLGVNADEDGNAWYEVSDGWSRGIHVPAQHLRRIDPAEITPISPDVPLSSKRIVVDTAKQRVTAFENGAPVFTAKVATGAEFRKADGSTQDYRTTRGEHRIYEKRFSSRMQGGGVQSDPDFYDLPGVAWVSYFTASRIAFHAAYWHNDFGWPRSHGCVNMLPDDAKWVYRWTMPTAGYDQKFTRVAKFNEGSLVSVI